MAGAPVLQKSKRIALLDCENQSPSKRLEIWDEAVKTIDDFCDLISNSGCNRIFIYGTEVMRRLGQAFCVPPRKPGTEFQILSGREEAECALAAGIIGTKTGLGSSLAVFNQGAGSAELAMGRRTEDGVELIEHRFATLGWRKLARIVQDNSEPLIIEQMLRFEWAKQCEHLDLRSTELIILTGAAARDYGWITASPLEQRELRPGSFPRPVSKAAALDFITSYLRSPTELYARVTEASSSLPPHGLIGYLYLLKMLLPDASLPTVVISQVGTQHGFAWLALNNKLGGRRG